MNNIIYQEVDNGELQNANGQLQKNDNESGNCFTNVPSPAIKNTFMSIGSPDDKNTMQYSDYFAASTHYNHFQEQFKGQSNQDFLCDIQLSNFLPIDQENRENFYTDPNEKINKEINHFDLSNIKQSLQGEGFSLQGNKRSCEKIMGNQSRLEEPFKQNNGQALFMDHQEKNGLLNIQHFPSSQNQNKETIFPYPNEKKNKVVDSFSLGNMKQIQQIENFGIAGKKRSHIEMMKNQIDVKEESSGQRSKLSQSTESQDEENIRNLEVVPNSQCEMNYEQLRNTRGLRYLSLKVKDIVCKKKHTGYKDVADSLVEELKQMGTNQLSYEETIKDEQNIKRRVYDALNVLIASEIVSKKGKAVMQNNTTHLQGKCLNEENWIQLKELQKKIEEKKERIDQKKQILADFNKKSSSL